MKMKFVIYENPETSEVSEEFDSLPEALRMEAAPASEIIQNGVVMAVRGERWELTAEGLKLECGRFANGVWQREVPTRVGRYPTATSEGLIAIDRYLVSHGDKLLDASNHRLKEGSEWAGWWWSEPYPEMPSAPNWRLEEAKA